MQLRLIEKRRETDDVLTFVWEPEEPIEWQAGQYLKYTLPHDNPDDRGTSRWFTIAAPPYEGKPRITTRIASEKGSSFKAALAQLEPGATIQATKPSGDFVVSDPSRPLILVAGGIGITPFRAILLQLHHDGIPLHAHLLYANRNNQYVFKDELETVATQQPDFHIEYFTGSRRVELSDLQMAATGFQEPLYYLSGPESMVQYYQNLLQDAQTPEPSIKTDFFPGYD